MRRQTPKALSSVAMWVYVVSWGILLVQTIFRPSFPGATSLAHSAKDMAARFER